MATIYAIAHNLKMPGVQVQAHLDPTTLTTRMFNSVRKMIASGRVDGFGGAARVARHVLDSQDVSYIGNSKWGVKINGQFTLDEASKERCRELYQAYVMVCKVQDSPQYNKYWDDKAALFEKTISNTNGGGYIQCDLAACREQIAEVYLQNRFSIDGHKAQQVLTAFETGQSFPVNVFQ